jgi:hypothetical protein
MKRSRLSCDKIVWGSIIILMQDSCHWEKNNWALIRVVLLFKWATISIHMEAVSKDETKQVVVRQNSAGTQKLALN